MFIQTIKFDNDRNGNPRAIMLKYDLRKNKLDNRGFFDVPEVIEVGYEGVEAHIKDNDIVLPTIYNRLSYRDTLKQFK